MGAMGMGMHMGLHQVMEQRQEQRLEQRLALSQIQGLNTDGGYNAEDQSEKLKKILADLNNGVFSDVGNFHDRVMKRIKISERSEEIRELIGSIRGIIDECEVGSLEDVRKIVNLGVLAYEKASTAPSVELEQARKIIAGSPLGGNQKLRVVDLGLKHYEVNNGGGYLFPLLIDLGTDPRTSRGEIFMDAFETVGRLVSENKQGLRYLSENLLDVLPSEVDSNVMNSGIEGLLEHWEMNGYLDDVYPNKGLRGLLGRGDIDGMKKEYHIPLPILAFLGEHWDSPQVLERVGELCSDKHFRKTRDVQRAVQRGFSSLNDNNKGGKVVEHVTSILQNSRQLVRAFGYMGLFFGRSFEYDFKAVDFNDLERRLGNRATSRAFGTLFLSQEYKNKLIERGHELNSNLVNIISVLGPVYNAYYPDEVPVLKRVVESMIDDNFSEWRYGHDKAEGQLKVLNGKKDKWVENRSDVHVLGDTKGVQPRIDAVRQMGEEVGVLYRGMYGKAPNTKTARKIESEVQDLVREMREQSTPDFERREIGLKLTKIREEYSTLKMVDVFREVDLTNINMSRKLFVDKVKSTKDPELKNLYEQATKVLMADELDKIRKVSVVESDNLFDLFEVGRIPIQSCQRWTERTGYNDCLMAYVADPNKKLLQVKDERFSTIGRSILRLLPLENEPLLFVERPYASSWSRDHSKAMMISVMRKAHEMANETGRDIAVGSNHGDFVGAMKELVGEEVEIEVVKKRIAMPRSYNPVEYSDGLGGRIESGAKVSGNKIRYVLVGQNRRE